MKEQKTSTLVSAAVYVGIGLILILFPALIGKTLCYILSGAFMAMGIVCFIGYFMLAKEVREQLKPYGLIKGAALIILGIFVLAESRLIISIIPFILGAMILLKGIGGAQWSLSMKSRGLSGYKKSLISSLVIIIFGAVMMANPFRTAKLISVLLGIGLIVSGAEDFILEVQTRRAMKDTDGEGE